MTKLFLALLALTAPALGHANGQCRNPGQLFEAGDSVFVKTGEAIHVLSATGAGCRSYGDHNEFRRSVGLTGQKAVASAALACLQQPRAAAPTNDCTTVMGSNMSAAACARDPICSRCRNQSSPGPAGPARRQNLPHVIDEENALIIPLSN